jgi:acid phosphatase type 7
VAALRLHRRRLCRDLRCRRPELLTHGKRHRLDDPRQSNGVERCGKQQRALRRHRFGGRRLPSDVLADNPVGYWRLGETSGTTATDETANNDSGTYQNGVTLGAAGALVGDVNAAPSFDGVNNQVNMGNPASGIFKFGTSSFTLEAWIKTPVRGTQLTDDMPIVAKQSPITANPSWEVTFTDDTNFVGRIRAKLNDSTGTTLKAYSGVRVDDGKWHHVVATFDRANGITVYVDAVPTFTAGATTGDVNNNTALLIGQERRVYPYFKGQIDEVALYRGLLPSARIKSHYENGAAIQTSPPTNTALPTISGITEKGRLLSASPGTWTGTLPLNFAYQWQRCDSTGAGCANIAAATTSSYTLATAAIGSTLRVSVTALNAGGSTLAASPPTAVIADASPDPVIAAAGDIACRSNPVSSGTTCHYGLTSNLITTDPRITDVLPLGDDQYDCGDYQLFLNFFGPTWGSILARFHPIPGNHEYLTYAPQNPDGSQPPGTLASCDPATTVPGAGYFDYWNGVGADTGRAGDRDKGYYSYDVGSWHLIALNAECYAVGGCDAGSPEETWLKADLAAHSNVCTLAYWHEPRFSSGFVGNNPYVSDFWKDLYDAGADIVLNGHDHDYERFAPQNPLGQADPARGLREWVVGTGGRGHGGFPTIQPNSEVRNAETYGVLKLTLHPSSYDWQFVPESGKTFSDSGSGLCH